MKRNWLCAVGTILRRSCGAALVFAASANVAFATPPAPPGVPEIDPGSVAAGLTLFVGGLVLLTDRLRGKERPASRG